MHGSDHRHASDGGVSPRRVVHGLFFFPRGGSAQVTRALCTALPALGWRSTLACGSRGSPGGLGHARTFFGEAVASTVEYGLPPGLVQPSYEPHPHEPDPVFCELDEASFERLVDAWISALRRADAGGAEVLHLHHLTPINEAAARAFPGVPAICHLHGTELGMVRAAVETPERWPYAEAWMGRMARWARGCDRLVLPGTDTEDAASILGVPVERVVSIPNGIDTRVFERRPLAGANRLAHWRAWLVEQPQGWDESGRPGSVAYDVDDLAPFVDGGAVLVFVGRFTEVKRLPLLLQAYARARRSFERRSPLVLIGGYPGEYEGAHPLQVVREAAIPDVFLAGWHALEEIADALNAADVLVLPSAQEAFGLPLAEAMSCGLPVIATDSPGARTIVEDGQNGWLVPADDEEALSRTLVEAVNDPAERRRRGERAYAEGRGRYAWPRIAERFVALYEEVARPASQGGEVEAASRR